MKKKYVIVLTVTVMIILILTNYTVLMDRLLNKPGVLGDLAKKIDCFYFYTRYKVLGSKEKNSSFFAKQNVSLENRLIAHAGGEIGGYTYTNSLQAMDNSYEKGFKLFELDIAKTSDNVFVAVYDWKQWKEITGYTGSLPPEHKSFKSYQLHSTYTPIDINDINNWFALHKDAVLITDKIDLPAEFAHQFIDKNRLIMELFSWKAVFEGLEHNIDVMPNWSIIEGVDEDIIYKLLTLGISKITASRYVQETHLNTLKILNDNNIQIYAYHINRGENPQNEKYVLCKERDYFYGLYADKWDFQEKLECNE